MSYVYSHINSSPAGGYKGRTTPHAVIRCRSGNEPTQQREHQTIDTTVPLRVDHVSQDHQTKSSVRQSRGQGSTPRLRIFTVLRWRGWVLSLIRYGDNFTRRSFRTSEPCQRKTESLPGDAACHTGAPPISPRNPRTLDPTPKIASPRPSHALVGATRMRPCSASQEGWAMHALPPRPTLLVNAPPPPAYGKASGHLGRKCVNLFLESRQPVAVSRMIPRS